jgi:hypothetical protein
MFLEHGRIGSGLIYWPCLACHGSSPLASSNPIVVSTNRPQKRWVFASEVERAEARRRGFPQ